MLKISDVTMQHTAAGDQRTTDVAVAKISFWLEHLLESDRS
jgi:hypothetical protein